MRGGEGDGSQDRLLVLTVFKGGRGTPILLLGPKAYRADLGLRLDKGMDATFVGVPRPGKKRDLVLVRSVTAGGRTWTLRNEKGQPLWREGAVEVEGEL